MHFTKMHGIGNDYVYVECFTQAIADPPELARIIADRHYGVGGDGLILMIPSDTADVRMAMYNADGSEGLMCGNGVRCVAKYVFDHDLSRSNPMIVETASGPKKISLLLDEAGKVASATVDMGEPILKPTSIPVNVQAASQAVDVSLRTGRNMFKMTCVSMGNPHAVIYVDDVDSVPLAAWGPEVETHPLFPDRVNVHFVQVISGSEVKMITWERGSGITLACGTGAAAVCVAGVLSRKTSRDIIAHLPGGDLDLSWKEDNNRVYMTGPAVEVFSGEWPDDD